MNCDLVMRESYSLACKVPVILVRDFGPWSFGLRGGGRVGKGRQTMFMVSWSEGEGGSGGAVGKTVVFWSGGVGGGREKWSMVSLSEGGYGERQKEGDTSPWSLAMIELIELHQRRRRRSCG
ncbi:hypothetical protein RRG08_004642 [Elysia crispata]|uniref:Uncharacterized protein n=1 Tax=Elysia crispata TaxID=231223 RepID=A0AAE0ZF85_9GAST|nr:hypothetical protein RRG08_004642 [Elysia crispata]